MTAMQWVLAPRLAGDTRLYSAEGGCIQMTPSPTCNSPRTTAARLVARDRARAETEHRNQMIMHSLDVVIHEKSQPLGETMIDFGHVVQELEQFLIGWTANGQRVADGDHAFAMTTERCHPLIKLPDVPINGVGQIARAVCLVHGLMSDSGKPQLPEQRDAIEAAEESSLRIDPMPASQPLRRIKQNQFLVITQRSGAGVQFGPRLGRSATAVRE